MNINFGTDMIGVAAVIWLATAIVHMVFALAVFDDAGDVRARGGRTTFVGPWIWALAVLLGGVFVAGVYWLMHHSQLRRAEPVGTEPNPGDPPPYERRVLPRTPPAPRARATPRVRGGARERTDGESSGTGQRGR